MLEQHTGIFLQLLGDDGAVHQSVAPVCDHFVEDVSGEEDLVDVSTVMQL